MNGVPKSPPRPSAVLGAGLVLAVSLILPILLTLLTSPARAQGSVELLGLGGERFTEAELSRGPTIVIVWASWSPRGRDVIERVNAVHQSWNSRCRVVTVNFQEDRAAIESFLAGKSLRAPVLMDRDGSFAKRYAITSLPGLLVFRDGQKAFGGHLPDNPDRVLAEIFP